MPGAQPRKDPQSAVFSQLARQAVGALVPGARKA
jgi:hypothetical protein